ncbi:MAG: helix-turn-helix transcriptional regulator [Lachnospiraceae bacterium]|nr:helix-turn-helix transcriptional regulator [Lachnospiraceae bacterium]
MQYIDYGTSDQKYNISPVTVESIHYVMADNKHFEQHEVIPDGMVLVMTLSGQGRICLENKQIEIKSDDILLFDASKEKFQCYSLNSAWNFWWFEFRCLETDLLKLPLEIPQSTVLSNVELRLCEEALSSLKRKDVKAASYVFSALLCLLQRECLEMAEMKNDTGIFRRADQYIYNNLASVNVKSLAGHLNMSERACLDFFQSAVGMRTLEYILNRKMDVAYRMLVKNEKTLSEIAELLGYKDQFAFSKSFRKRFGISPSEVKQSVGRKKNV